MWVRSDAPVTIPEEVIGVVLVKVIPKFIMRGLIGAGQRNLPTPGWFCIDLRLLFLGNREGSLFGHRGGHNLILIVRRRHTVPGVMAPYVFVVR